MDAYDYIGSRREALDAELAHETRPRGSNSTLPATGKQASFLRALLAQAERAGYAHGLRHAFVGPTLLKGEAAQAIDSLIGARNRGWR